MKRLDKIAGILHKVLLTAALVILGTATVHAESLVASDGGTDYNTASTGRLGGDDGSGIVIVRGPLGAVATADPFTLSSILTGSEEFTNTNYVNIAAFPVPADYDSFQLTGEEETVDALNPAAWLSTNDIPALLAAPITFAKPLTDTNITLYAWFTNTTDTAAPLKRALGTITYTTAAPTAVARPSLLRAIVGDRQHIILTAGEIDNGSHGGTTGGMEIPFFGSPAITCPQDQTPDAPFITLNEVGVYTVTLTVTNLAGSSASDTCQVTVTTRDAALYVSLDGDNTSGTDWTTAFSDIQTALDTAVSNDTIYLAGQTFALTGQLLWTNSFITLRGGYKAAGDTLGARDPTQWPTIITRAPNINTRLLYISAKQNIELDGITFTDGHPEQPTDISGGGAVVITGTANLLLRDCHFKNNYILGIHNTSCHGGALHIANSSGMVSNVLLIANEVQGRAGVGYGGAINISGGAVHLRDIVVLGNRSRGEWATEPSRHGRGGGISFHGGTHSLTNALLFLNQARRHIALTATEGSGIYVWNKAAVAIAHATIVGHSSDGLYIDSGNVTLNNSILSGNYPDIGGGGTLTLSHSLVGDGTGGESADILTGDPGFDEEWFYLAPASPCRQAGAGTVADTGLTGYTVSTDGAAEASIETVSIGYHYPPGSALEPFTEVYVAADTGSDDATGGEAQPFKTLSRALQATTGRLRINLLPGIYDNVADFPLQLFDRPALQIIGGDPQTTIIDGKNAANKRLFEYFCAFGNNRISGVTLRGGGGSIPDFDGIRAGGAIHLSRSRLTLENCVASNNLAGVGIGAGGLGIHTLGGGAIGAKQAALSIRSSTFRANSTTWCSAGGAILALATVGTISDCLFSNNVADAQTGPGGHNRSMSGGALHLGRSSFEITNTRFIANKAIAHQGGHSGGGAIFYCDGRVIIRNSIFADNRVSNNSDPNPLYGAALYQHTTTSPATYLSTTRRLALENCTLVGNHGDGGEYGHGVYGNDDYMRFVNTILYDNQPSDFDSLTPAAFTHCRADLLVAGEQGNITADPLLIDPANGNYGLRTLGGQFTRPGSDIQRYGANSPCIDSGINLAWMVNATDLRGFPHRARGLPTSGGEPRVDMGAIEVHIPATGTLLLIK